MNTVEEFAEDIRTAPVTGGQDVDLSRPLAHHLIKAGYRKVFDGDCGLSGVKDPDEREAAEAWMRWANLAMNDEIGAIGAMQRMLTEFGFRRPRQVSSVEELDALRKNAVIMQPGGTVLVHDGQVEDPWASYAEDPFGGPIWTSSAHVTLPVTVLHEGSL